MPNIAQLAAFLNHLAPPALAESWDNVGLLVGDEAAAVERVMTCLTITPPVVEEAVRAGVQLIVAHHPLPFRPLNRLTTDTPEGRMILELAAHRVAIYSPHTAFDSAPDGINQRLARGLELEQIEPLVEYAGPPLESEPETNAAAWGAGRHGVYAAERPLTDVVERAKQLLSAEVVQVVGDPRRPIRRLAVACGSAGEFLRPARELGCDALLTGETRFHTCLEAEATGIALVLVGHYASERFAVEHLAERLAEQFPQLDIWPSRDERDPIRWL